MSQQPRGSIGTIDSIGSRAQSRLSWVQFRRGEFSPKGSECGSKWRFEAEQAPNRLRSSEGSEKFRGSKVWQVPNQILSESTAVKKVVIVHKLSVLQVRNHQKKSTVAQPLSQPLTTSVADDSDWTLRLWPYGY